MALGLEIALGLALVTGLRRWWVLAPTAACPIATCFQLEAQVVAGSAQAGDEWTYQLWSDGRKRRMGDGGAWIMDWRK